MKRYLHLWAVATGYVVTALAIIGIFMSGMISLGMHHPIICAAAIVLMISAFLAYLMKDNEDYI